jgi:DNA-binding NarL/FixJ family response regulator
MRDIAATALKDGIWYVRKQMIPETSDRCPSAKVGYASSKTSATTIHVLLVENDSCAVDAIVRDFSRNTVNVTVAHTLAEARMFLRQTEVSFHVVILDLRLPDGRGESLLPNIEACSRQPAVIITSAFLPELHMDALQYRPVVVAKPISTAALLRMVRTVVGGYARPVIRRFVRGFNLSRRETEAIVLVAQGLKAKEIADRMRCSEPTIYGHLAHVCAKTDCSDYHEVVAKLFAFACQALGHTPPDHRAFVERRGRARVTERCVD